MRQKRSDYPLRIEILQTALELYVKDGFTSTTNQMIATKVGCSTGQITNFFGTKENILCEIVRQVLPFHQGTLSESTEKDISPEIRYCMEVAVQIAMCEQIDTVHDLYVNAYTLPKPFEFIRGYSYKKSISLFSEHLPDWSEQDFYETEAASMGIVYSCGLMDRCNSHYSLRQKLKRTLDVLLKIYEFRAEERERIIKIVLSCDIEKVALQAHRQMYAQVEESIHRENR